MRFVLVAEREELAEHIRHHFSPQGSELIHYWNPIKAMDNLDEIDPDVVLFSARDFPRHWKTFVTFLRGFRAKEQTVFILFTGEELSYEEASKAQHLGVNGVVGENIEDKQELGRLRELVVRYKDVDEVRKEKRFVPGDADRVDFVFSHPATLQAIVGTISDISVTGLRFTPHNPSLALDLKADDLLDLCSLRLGPDIIFPACRVVRNKGSISVSFCSLEEGDRETINTYLMNRSERELSRRAKQESLVSTADV